MEHTKLCGETLKKKSKSKKECLLEAGLQSENAEFNTFFLL